MYTCSITIMQHFDKRVTSAAFINSFKKGRLQVLESCNGMGIGE